MEQNSEIQVFQKQRSVTSETTVLDAGSATKKEIIQP